MILNLSYGNLLKSTSAAAVPLYLGSHSKSFTKWLGVAAELAYNPHLRNGWVTVDTGVKGSSGSPLIEFSTWEARNSTYNVVLPNSFAFKFLVTPNGISAQFLSRSSVEANEFWTGNLFENSIVNSWDTRVLSAAVKSAATTAQRNSIFYISQKWASSVLSGETGGACQISLFKLNLSAGFLSSDFFYRDLTSSFLFVRKSVKHRQYRVRFLLYENSRLSGKGLVRGLVSSVTAKFVHIFFFKSIVGRLRGLYISDNKSASVSSNVHPFSTGTSQSFRSLLTKLNLLVLVLTEIDFASKLGSALDKLLGGLVWDLVEVYSAPVLSVPNRNTFVSKSGLSTFLTVKLGCLLRVTALSGFALTTLILFVVKIFISSFVRATDVVQSSSLRLYSYKFCRLRLKSILTNAQTSSRNSLFLSSHVSTADFLTTYSCHRGNRLRVVGNSRKFRVRRGAQFLRRRRSKSVKIVDQREGGGLGLKLLFRKRWKRLLKYFKVSSAQAQFNFVFFWSFNFFSFTNLKMGYRKFFYLSVRVIYFFRQFLKFFKFYSFYFQLLRALEFKSEALFAGERTIFNNLKLFSLLLFKKFGRVLWAFNSFCVKLFSIRWKKVSVGLLDSLRKARGIVFGAAAFRPLVYKSLSYSSMGATVRILHSTYLSFFNKNFIKNLSRVKTVRGYLRYMLNLRKQIRGVWLNKLLAGLLSANLNSYSLFPLTVNGSAVLRCKRFFFIERFAFGRRSAKLSLSKLIRRISFGKFESNQAFSVERLIAKMRVRRTFALRSIKRETSKYLKTHLFGADFAKYLTFVGSVSSAAGGCRKKRSFGALRVASHLTSGASHFWLSLLRFKKQLLTAKHRGATQSFVRIHDSSVDYNTNCLYSLAQTFYTVLVQCGSPPFKDFFTKKVGGGSSLILPTLIKVLSASFSGDSSILANRWWQPWAISSASRGRSISFCSREQTFMFRGNPRELLFRNSSVNFFDGLGLQYSRINVGGFARNTLAHNDFVSLFFCDFRYLTRLMVGASFQFIGGVLGRLNFFLNSLFSSTLLSRFLCSSFFVGSNFGLNYKIYSHLFWKKNRIILHDDPEFDSSGGLSRFKDYLLRTTANTFIGCLSFSIAQQLSVLPLSGNFTAGFGDKASAVLSRVPFEAFFYGNNGALFNHDVDGGLYEDSFMARSCIFVARKGVIKSPLPIFLARLSNRRGGGLVRSKKGSTAGLVAVSGRRFRAKYFTRLLNVSLRLRSQDMRFRFVKRIIGSFSVQYLRGMLWYRTPVFIAATTLRNSHENGGAVLAVERRNSVSFLKRLVGVVDMTFFRTPRANKSYWLAYHTYKRDCSQFFTGIRGIRPLKLFAHAKRIGLWPKNLKLWPVRARHKQPPFKLITYRHSRAALLKSNKVKMPPGIFSRENYESMNLIWDFPHQNYKFARVNAFQRLRAWKYVRRQMSRRLFSVVLKKLRIRGYKRAFRYRKYLRKRWFRMKLKRRVLRGLARMSSKMLAVGELRKVYFTGNFLKKIALGGLANHSTRLMYALVLKAFVGALYVKFDYLRTNSKAYFLKVTKLQFLFLALRGFFFKMLTFFSNYNAVQKFVFNEFLSSTTLLSYFGCFSLHLFSNSGQLLRHENKVELCRALCKRLLGSINSASSSGFKLTTTYLASRSNTRVSPDLFNVYGSGVYSGFTSFIFFLLDNPLSTSRAFVVDGFDCMVIRELFASAGFNFVCFTRRRTRKFLKNIELVRVNIFSKPTRSVKILRVAARRDLVTRSKTHLKLRLQKLLKSWRLGRASQVSYITGGHVRAAHPVRLRWIYLQLFWYLRSTRHYTNLARILSTASRIVKNRHHRFLLTFRLNSFRVYTHPIWANARKKRAFSPLVRYWRRKKIRRQVRLRRRVGRRVLPIREGTPISLKKKWRIKSNSLFWNRRVRGLSQRALFVKNFGVVRSAQKRFPTRFNFFGNLNLKGMCATADGSVRLGRALNFGSKRRVVNENFARAFLLRRFRTRVRPFPSKGRFRKKQIRRAPFDRVVKHEIQSKKLYRLNSLRAEIKGKV